MREQRRLSDIIDEINSNLEELSRRLPVGFRVNLDDADYVKASVIGYHYGNEIRTPKRLVSPYSIRVTELEKDVTKFIDSVV